MADDYSLDPLQTQEDELTRLQRESLAQRLRYSNPAAGDAVGQAMRGFNNSAGAVLDQQTAQKRQDLAAQAQRALTESLRGFSPDVQALMGNQSTRAEGAKLISKEAEQRMFARQDADDRAAAQRQKQASGSTMPDAPPGAEMGGDSYATKRSEADALLRSHDPVKRALGKELMELLKPQDPTHTTAIVDGKVVTLPGSIDALKASIEAGAHGRDKMIEVSDGQGGKIQVPEQEWLASQRKSSVLPGATGALASPGPTAPVAPPTGLSSAPPGVNPSALPGVAAATRPQPTVPSPTNGVGRPGMMVDPEVQKQRDGVRLQVLGDELKAEMAKPPGDPTTQRNIAALQKEIQQTAGKYGVNPQSTGQNPRSPEGVAASGGMAPPAPPQQGGLPPPQAFLDPNSRIQRTPGAPGTMNPGNEAIYQDRVKSEIAQLQKKMEGVQQVNSVMSHLDSLEELNKSPLYTGAFPGVHNFISQVGGEFGQKYDPRYEKSGQFTTVVNDLIQNKAKLLGTNPSDSDREFIKSGMPSLNDDAQTRAAKVARLRQISNNTQQEAAAVQQMVSQGATVAGAETAYAAWRKAKEQAERQVPPNPTQAGGSQPAAPAALPSAISAAQAAPPGAPPQRPVAGPDLSAPPGGGFTGFMGDVGRSIKSLPSAAMAVPQAANDTIRNVGRGAEELVGAGQGREADMAAIHAQELRRQGDPAYNQARAFTDITANPLSYLGGGSTSILKLASIAGVQNLLQPAQSFGEQVVEGVKGAAIGAFLGGLTKLLPSTGSDVAGVTKGMREFPSVRPTSAQLNPNSLESKLAAGLGVNDAAAMKQVEGLTKDLATKAGMKTAEITPETIAATKKELGAEFDTIFSGANRTGTARVATNTQADLKQGIDRSMGGPATRTSQDINAMMTSQEAPALGRLYAAIQDTTNPMNIRIKDLHEAWKEVGEVAKDPQAARAVRDMLESTIEKVIGKDKLAAFRDTSMKYGNLNDIERVYAGAAGMGEGKASAFLSPNAIKGADPSMVPGAAMDQARAYIKATGMKEGKTPIIAPETSIPSALAQAGKKLAGPLVNRADRAIPHLTGAPQSVKNVIEALRRPTIANIKAGRQEDQNAP